MTEQAKKLRETMIKKHGSYENWVEFLKKAGKAGGATKTEKTKKRGYGTHPELAVINGRKGKKKS